MVGSTNLFSKEKMDDNDLRKILYKKIKRDLVELTNILNEECPTLNLNFDATSLDHDTLASRLWEILLYLKRSHPEHYIKYINILSEEVELVLAVYFALRNLFRNVCCQS